MKHQIYPYTSPPKKKDHNHLRINPLPPFLRVYHQNIAQRQPFPTIQPPIHQSTKGKSTDHISKTPQKPNQPKQSNLPSKPLLEKIHVPIPLPPSNGPPHIIAQTAGTTYAHAHRAYLLVTLRLDEGVYVWFFGVELERLGGFGC